jgi:hypothetical protein
MLILKAGTVNFIRQTAVMEKSANTKTVQMQQAVDEPQGRHVQQKRKLQCQQ